MIITYSGARKVKSVKVVEKLTALTPASPFAGVTADDLGKIIGADGNLYADVTAATDAGTTAVAKIAYVGSDAETSTTYNHGLALALEDVSDEKSWCSQKSAYCLATQYSSSYGDTGARVDVGGIANTDALVGHATHTHAAAQAARNYGVTRPEGTSEWFLPSVGQWDKMLTAVGGDEQLGLQTGNYWLSSESNMYDMTSLAYYYENNSYHTFGSASKDVSTEYYVRACLAF